MIHSAYLMQDKPKKAPPEYRARPFCDGIALLAKNGKWGAIDKKGNTAIPFEFDYIDHFNRNEKAMAKIGEKYAVIDKTGKILSQFKLETKQYIVGSFSEDLFTVDFLGEPVINNNGTTYNRKCGYMNEISKIVIPQIHVARGIAFEKHW